MERRLVLLGKTGSGKSSCGNTILQERCFEVKSSPESVTKRCEIKRRNNIRIVDTPSLFHTTLTPDELKTEIGQCVNKSIPGPHAFLLVIRLGRFTEEEKKAVEWIEENFGKEASLYTIVLFTHGDHLGEATIEQFITDSPQLRRLINTCGGRYHVFNNKDQRPGQVDTLMRKIDEMVHMNGREYYTKEMYQEAQRTLDVSNALVIASTLAAGAAIIGVAVLKNM